MNIRDLVIDAKATIGENLVCVDVIEKAVYKDGIKTDEIKRKLHSLKMMN